MALSSADNPATEPAKEPEAESAPAKKAAKVKAEPEPAPELVRAFTSGNAEVHDLVAQWEIASSNQDKAHLAAVEAKLAALGYRI
jgi:hypothetical protein